MVPYPGREIGLLR